MDAAREESTRELSTTKKPALHFNRNGAARELMLNLVPSNAAYQYAMLAEPIIRQPPESMTAPLKSMIFLIPSHTAYQSYRDHHGVVREHMSNLLQPNTACKVWYHIDHHDTTRVHAQADASNATGYVDNTDHHGTTSVV